MPAGLLFCVWTMLPKVCQILPWMGLLAVLTANGIQWVLQIHSPGGIPNALLQLPCREGNAPSHNLRTGRQPNRSLPPHLSCRQRGLVHGIQHIERLISSALPGGNHRDRSRRWSSRYLTWRARRLLHHALAEKQEGADGRAPAADGATRASPGDDVPTRLSRASRESPRAK